MRELPPYVYAQRSRGYTYYYFNVSKEPYRREYVRLPDIADPSFDDAVAKLAVQKPVTEIPKGTPHPKRELPQSYVYFIGGEVGAIKIGRSADPEARLAKLQTGSPIKLRLLAVTNGGMGEEHGYHMRFSRARLDGEWFNRTPAILAEIDRLNAEEIWVEQNEPVQNGFQNEILAEKLC